MALLWLGYDSLVSVSGQSRSGRQMLEMAGEFIDCGMDDGKLLPLFSNNAFSGRSYLMGHKVGCKCRLIVQIRLQNFTHIQLQIPCLFAHWMTIKKRFLRV